MTPEVTREALLERVQQLTPVIREYADRAEQERHLADPVVAACCWTYHLTTRSSSSEAGFTDIEVKPIWGYWSLVTGRKA